MSNPSALVNRLPATVFDGGLRRAAWMLGLVVVLVYCGMPARELTFDSAYIIGQDTRLRAFSAETLQAILQRDYWWPSILSNLYRPLTTFSFTLEYSVLGFAQNPVGYQINNALLHWLNGLLVFVLARRLWDEGVAWVSAGLFLLHPLATEVVSNIVGRSDLLATTATLGGVLLYFSALNESKPGVRIRFFLGAGGCALFGVLAKESAIVLPAIIAWHGLLRAPEELKGTSTVRRRWFFDAGWVAMAMAPAFLLVLWTRWYFSQPPGVTEHPFIDNPLILAGFWEAKATALGVLGMQLWALFVPLTISSDYSFNAIPLAQLPWGNATAMWAWVSVFAMLTMVVAAWRTRTAPHHRTLFLLGAFVIAVIPTSNLLLVIGSIRADRFQYLPSAIFWVLVIGWLKGACASLAQTRGGAVIGPLKVARVLGLTWALCLLFLAHVRCYDWRSNLTLWRSAEVAAPGSAKIQGALANELVRVVNDEATLVDAIVRGEKALQIYQQAKVPLEYWPFMIFSDLQAFHAALYDALSKDPARAHEAERILMRGMEIGEQGLRQEEMFRQQWAARWVAGDMSKAPVFELLHRNYVELLHRQERWLEAGERLDALIDQMPFRPSFRNLKAKNLVAQGQKEEALAQWALISFLSPEDAFFVTSMAKTIQEISPSAQPLSAGANGEQRLNLADREVIRALERSRSIYVALLQKEGRTRELARFKRIFRYEYGIPDRPL